MRFDNIGIIHASAVLLASFLAACGGGSGGESGAQTGYTIGGMLSGLTGTGLVLQNNAADDLAASADGSFTFVTPVIAYAVTVKTQPGNPVQTCTVNSGSGTASANVTGVAVTCSTNAYTVSGSVSGLAGTGLVLQDNSGDDLAISANGAFTFAASVASGANYNVTVKTQPTLLSQTCTVTNGSGTVTGANIGGVVVNCVTPSPRFAYVANSSDNTVSIYTVNAATGQLRHNGYAMTGASPHSVTVDPSGRFAYVANWGDNTISAYNINVSSGALTGVGTVPAGTWPYAVTVDPSGKFAYVANEASFNVSAYTIDASTGALTEVDQNGAAAGTAVAAGRDPRSVTVDPSGRFAYVANANDNNISAYSINATTGALTSVGATVATESIPQSVTVDPSGKFAYVANLGSDTVSAYTINASTGALTSVGTAVATGTSPTSVSVDPTGRFAYVANLNSFSVSAYSINVSSGALTSIAGTTTGMNPRSVIIDPSGKFAYVASGTSNTVSVYDIDAGSGALTSAGTVSGRVGPFSIAMTRGATPVSYTPKFAYAANYGPSLQSNPAAYRIDPTTGALTRVPSESGGALLTAVATDPTGRFAYATRELLIESPDIITVLSYRIDAATGALTNPGNPALMASNPRSVTVDPSGRFAYVANQASNNVSAYTIDATTGELTSVGFVNAGGDPWSVSVDPSGRFVYLVNLGSNTVSAYTINPVSGVLTEIDQNGAAAGNALAVGTLPQSITVDPTGRIAYLTVAGNHTLAAYNIHPVTGALTGISASGTGGNTPSFTAVSPDGRFAYVTNSGSNDVGVLGIDAATGALTHLGMNVGAGTNPSSIAVDASGQFAYVTNLVSEDISVYRINASSGALSGAGSAVPAEQAPISITTTATIQ
ncbi:MAG: beta-propeller fold lactonase family protein [Sideroxyarcus sp.]|nr:beta-propeller fold lactonase family protein [Sideroxyarcus sp.]